MIVLWDVWKNCPGKLVSYSSLSSRTMLWEDCHLLLDVEEDMFDRLGPFVDESGCTDTKRW